MSSRYPLIKSVCLHFVCCFFLTLIVLTVVPTVAQDRTSAQVPTAALKEGRENYEQSRFFAAANLWEQAAAAYEKREEIINQVQALNYLSLAYRELRELSRAEEAIAKSITLLKSVGELEDRGVVLLAQALNTRGSLELKKGQTEAAEITWSQAAEIYDRAEDRTGAQSARINQARSLQILGQYPQSKSLLEGVSLELASEPDSLLKVRSLRMLAITLLQTTGDVSATEEILEQSLAISRQFNAPAEISATLFTLGNFAKNRGQDNIALDYYRRAEKIAKDPIAIVQSQLNQLSLLVQMPTVQDGISLVSEITSKMSKLPASRPSIYAKINLAESLMKYEAKSRLARKSEPLNFQFQISELLASAVFQARELQDPLGEAYALNQLGKLYGENQQWEEARSLAQQALEIGQSIDAGEITARAASQLGMILKKEGTIQDSLAAYQTAFTSLQSLRSDLVAMNRELQYDFQESVEPVYRELLDLLLQPDATPEDLKEAREVVEALQLAELDNFFGDACLKSEPVDIDSIDSGTAVIHSIILSDRLEVIISVPNQPLRHYSTYLPQREVKAVLRQLKGSFSFGYNRQERLHWSEEVYNWLIRPVEADLANNGIKNLLFVSDGPLLDLPLAALYDGKQYLVEKYSSAVSPGLQLFPQGLAKEKLKVLIGGLSEARHGFPPLPGVEPEVKAITDQWSGKVLLNQKFTSSSLQKAIDTQPFPVVHLATHGQFSSNPEETFLLTWDERLSVQDFGLLFENRKFGRLPPIDLLVMSACSTAAGDSRASLGLAGLALRSGARSTLGSLWDVNDESTTVLMSEFYRLLASGDGSISKAEAFRQAQLVLLQDSKYGHPFFWAPFVLVGNWL